MFRSAALCLLLAAVILPDLAAAQNSDWNPTGLEDGAFIGIIVAACVVFIFIVLMLAVCCCCFLCPGMCGGLSCFGQREYYDEQPYFEPPPPLPPPQPYYPPPPPEPEPYPFVISPPRPPPQEPVYIAREPEPRRERVAYVVRDTYDQERYGSYDNDRRVLISSSGYSRYGRNSGRYSRDYSRGSDRVYVTSDRYNDYDDRRYVTRSISPRRSPGVLRKNDYY